MLLIATLRRLLFAALQSLGKSATPCPFNIVNNSLQASRPIFHFTAKAAKSPTKLRPTARPAPSQTSKYSLTRADVALISSSCRAALSTSMSTLG